MARTRIALLVTAALASLFSQQASANPSGPSVASGTAGFATNGSTLTVTNSPNAILNWQSFSIATGETTRFNQQSAASAVLNRVTTNNASSILGNLQSNGRVFLINPNGIVFGSSAHVDVGGLVASTLNLSDSDFLSGRMRFGGGGRSGSVRNDGAINTTGAAAPVYLIGSAVTNGGVITSPQGEVILAAGNSVQIVNPGTPEVSVMITAPNSQALNLGQILADSGRINIFAGTINQNGLVRANTAVTGQDGKIVFKATRDATLAASSQTFAQGGSIDVSGSNLSVAGSTLSGPDNVKSLHQEFRATGDIVMTHPEIHAGASISDTDATQTINAGGTLRIVGGHGSIFSEGSQSFRARNIVMDAGPGTGNPDFVTGLFVTAARTQSITLTGGNFSLLSGGPTADMELVAVGGDQRIDFTSARRLLMDGRVEVVSDRGSQFITGSPDIDMRNGALYLDGQGSQTIHASSLSVTNSLITGNSIMITTSKASRSITEGTNGSIAAKSLTVAAKGDVDLGGSNRVLSFGGIAGGDVLFKNTSSFHQPTLTIVGLGLKANHHLLLAQDGNLAITGDVTSGAQTISATGTVLVSPSGSDGIAVHASGPQRIQSGGDMTIQAGTGSNAFAIVSSNRDIDLTVGGLLRLNGGSSPGAFARVQTDRRNSTIGLHFPNPSTDGWFVNGVDGAITVGNSGFFSDHHAAVLGKTLIVTHG